MLISGPASSGKRSVVRHCASCSGFEDRIYFELRDSYLTPCIFVLFDESPENLLSLARQLGGASFILISEEQFPYDIIPQNTQMLQFKSYSDIELLEIIDDRLAICHVKEIHDFIHRVAIYSNRNGIGIVGALKIITAILHIAKQEKVESMRSPLLQEILRHVIDGSIDISGYIRT